jgi:hypothetical protein
MSNELEQTFANVFVKTEFPSDIWTSHRLNKNESDFWFSLFFT